MAELYKSDGVAMFDLVLPNLSDKFLKSQDSLLKLSDLTSYAFITHVTHTPK